MNMLNKIKNQAQDKVNEVKDKANEMKQNYEDEQKAKWQKEVQLDDKNFKDVQQWFDLYEPKKQKQDNKDEPSGDSALKQKVMEMMSVQITKNIVKTIMECLAYANEYASKQIQQKEPKIFNFMNSVTAAFLTYRFQSKNEKKFSYIRGIAIDRISLSLIEVIDYEAQKAGKKVDQIDPQFIDNTIQKLITTGMSELEKQKQLAVDKFKASPLFSMSGANEQDVDEGVQMIILAAQSYADKKFGTLIEAFKTLLPQVLQTIAQHQQAIRANLAARSNQEPSDEYINNTRNQIANQIEVHHDKLFAFIKKFISGFFGVVQKNSDE